MIYKKLKDCCTIIAGQSPESKYYNTEGVGLPFFQGKADFGELYPTPRVYCSQPLRIAEKNDILLSVRAPVGPTNLAPCQSCIGRGLTAIRPLEFLDLKYLLYYFRYCEVQLQQKGTGTTVKAITQDTIKNISIPIPSVLEQERIVEQIEELLSQLTNSTETLKKAKQQLILYRQSLLKKAFEGEFTRIWRQNESKDIAMHDFEKIRIRNTVTRSDGERNTVNLSLPKTWLQPRIGDVFRVEVGATPSRQKLEYWNGDIHWVSSGEVHFNTITNTKECITEEGLTHSSTNIQPVGTVLLAMIGEGKTRGQAAILSTPAAHNQNTAAILVSKTPCHPKFLYYYLLLAYEHTRRIGSGNNQKALNKERVRGLRFPFSSFAEQALIVQEIETRMTICDNIEKDIENILKQASVLQQSIMKKAFEGWF